MIYFANLIHPFTGNRKLVVLQSQHPIDARLYLEEHKKPGLIVYSVDSYGEYFNVSHAECLDLASLGKIQYLEDLLSAILKKGKLTKKTKKELLRYFGDE